MKINPEKLGYCYFRLNGCFTLTNFVVHPSEGREQRTDVDIFAVRLPYRCELLVNPMQDDDVLLPNGNRTKLILAEVKKETCNLNGPWTKRERSNMQLAIAAAGAFSLLKPQGPIIFAHVMTVFYGEQRLSLTCRLVSFLYWN